MEHTSRANGDLKASYEQELFGRRRNVTFTTYLDITREAVDAHPARILPPRSTASRRRTYADGELDVFAAERYFKGTMDGDHKGGSAGAAVPVETTATTARSVVAVSKPAWTCASEASAGSGASANSQTVLLRDARRRPGYRGNKCCLQVGVLLRSCSRNQAQAVRIDGGAVTEAVNSDKPGSTVSIKPAASRIEWYRDLRMEKAGLGLARDGLPPNLNLGAAKVAAIGREATRKEKAADYTSASFRRRSFTLQAPVRVSSGRGRGGGDDDGGGSDSSSDLFEIKSLMIDDSPYEPSEASIQWSVVTASAADVSVMSERGGRVAATGSGRGRGSVAVRQQHRGRPVGRLTGCVSRRAVDVSAMAAVGRFPDAPSH